jgi:hypothetical protein
MIELGGGNFDAVERRWLQSGIYCRRGQRGGIRTLMGATGG